MIRKILNYFRDKRAERAIRVIDERIGEWLKVVPSGRIKSHDMYVYEELAMVRDQVAKILKVD